MINEKEVAFIICSNSNLFYNECVSYIDRLSVPEGYVVEVLCISDAKSMAEAYNAAMESSSAKFKIYLHQDVFIYNLNFICDVITIFKNNPDVGMLGMIGGINLPKDAIIWNSWNVGNAYVSDFENTFKVHCYQNDKREFTEVEAVDGMLIATQYDLWWREDLDLGWDFYDISHSLEFRRKGYKVVVPTQNSPWCLHDCGHSKLGDYDKSRKQFLKEYSDFFQCDFIDISDFKKQHYEDEIFFRLKYCIEVGKIEEVVKVKEQFLNLEIRNNNLQYLLNMCDIYEIEKKDSKCQKAFFTEVTLWDELIIKYNSIKFILRKIENGIWNDDADALIDAIYKGNISLGVVTYIAQQACVEFDKTYEYLCSEVGRKKQEESVKKLLIQMVELRCWDELCTLIQSNVGLKCSRDIVIQKIISLVEIYELENDNVTKNHSLLFSCTEWSMINEYYDWITMELQNYGEKRDIEKKSIIKNELETGMITEDVIFKLEDSMLKKTEYIFEDLLSSIDEEPLVSVIVCVYNGEQFVEKTIASILNQTYQNIEIIVVDDASSDNSRAVLQKFVDARIKIIALEKNRHICYAGNVGFAQAKGKYIALIGHDDIWEDGKLGKQVYFMEKHQKYAACFSWVNIIDEFDRIKNNEEVFLLNRFCSNNMTQEAWIKRLIMEGNFFCAPTVCVKREIIEKVGYYRYALVQLQDFDLWLRVLSEGPVYIIKQRLVKYRRFSQEMQNVSSINQSTINRDYHERQWIFFNYIENMSDDMFVKVFVNSIDAVHNLSNKEVKCEKAILLKKLGNCFAEKCFIELFEDSECRDILEQKYNYSLKDFYKWNTEPMFFDTAVLQQLNDLKKKIQG